MISILLGSRLRMYSLLPCSLRHSRIVESVTGNNPIVQSFKCCLGLRSNSTHVDYIPFTLKHWVIGVRTLSLLPSNGGVGSRARCRPPNTEISSIGNWILRQYLWFIILSQWLLVAHLLGKCFPSGISSTSWVRIISPLCRECLHRHRTCHKWISTLRILVMR